MFRGLDDYELQEVVFLTRSKKMFAVHFGVDQKETNQIWMEHGLMTPTEWMRNQDAQGLMTYLAEAGSYKKMAERYGVSPSLVKSLFSEFNEPKSATVPEICSQLIKYKSVRLTSRIMGVRESEIRRIAKLNDLDLSSMIDYSESDHHNGKGRRAELKYAELAGDAIEKDMNIEEGSQADYDFLDTDYGRVNVKSSRQYKYRAKTRRENPYYWKFSTKGKDKADYLALMCYDEKMKEFVGLLMMKTDKLDERATMTVTGRELREASEGYSDV